MMRKAVRISLLAILVAVVAAASWIVIRGERTRAASAEDVRRFEDASASLDAALADLRAAEQALVAAGQGEAYWAAQARDHLALVRARTDTLHQMAQTREAAGALERVQETAQALGELQGRAREYVIAGQKLMASDLIFGDGLELVRSAMGSVHLARAAERRDADQRLARARREQGVALGAAAAIGLAIALMLIPQRRSGAGEETATVAAVSDTSADLQGLRAEIGEAPQAPQVKPRDTSRAAAASAVESDGTLRQVAALCTDLARVSDAAELQRLLARATEILNATGLIVWVEQEPGGDIRAALAHGYAASAVSRLGVIARTADNATAAACREGRVQIVSPTSGSSGRSTGALVVPLVTAGRCTGAMALELDATVPPATVEALASIVAAQLATLIAGGTATGASPVAASGT